MHSMRWWLATIPVLLLVVLYLVDARVYNVQSPPEPQPEPVPRPEKAAILALEKTLAEVYLTDDGTTLEKCRLHEIDTPEDERKVMEDVNLPRFNVSLPEMLRVIEDCKVFSVNDSNSVEDFNQDENGTTNEGSRKVTAYNSTESKRPWPLVSGIMPGTKWCGMGDIAETYEELGPLRDLDRCCRAHDHCPIKLKAFRSGWGLINFSLYTKSHCDCDGHFYDCLKSTNTNLSNVLGNFYFNIMRVQCMKTQRPMVCAEKIVSLEGKSQCIRWKYVPTTPKMSFVNPEKRY